MLKRLKDFVGLPPKETHRDKGWEIVLSDGHYLIKMPWPWWIEQTKGIPKNRKGNTDFTKWTNTRVKIISDIVQHYENPHTYLRLHTYEVPDNLLTLGHRYSIEIRTIKKKKEFLILIPECNERLVWKASFDSGTAWHEGKILFTLKHQPENWKEEIDNYYRIVDDTFNLRKPISEFSQELQQCNLLCYAMLDNATLIIAKTDLSETVILSILEEAAHQEDLELVIKRQN